MAGGSTSAPAACSWQRRPKRPATAGSRGRVAVVKGQDSGRFTDFYHAVLTSNWLVFMVQLGVLFVGLVALAWPCWRYRRYKSTHPDGWTRYV